MTLGIGIVLAVLVMAIVLFVTETVRVDVVALLVLITLVLTGVLGFEEAFSGFSNEAVITVASVLVLSGALARTGVANIIGDRVLSVAGGGELRVLVTMMTTIGLLSGFMNDIGVAALMLPVVVEMARRIDRPPSKLLIPLSFGSLLGGMTTLIGTAPNILVSGALRDAGLEPFELFDFSPIGYAALAAGIVYMATLGRRLLPERRAGRTSESVSPDSLGGQYGLDGALFSVTVPEGSWLAGRTLAESRPGSALGITVLAIRREGRRHLNPDPDFRLEGGDRLLLSGREDLLRGLHAWRDLEVVPSDVSLEELAHAGFSFAEVSLPEEPASTTLADWNLRGRFGVTVLGVRQRGAVRLTHLAELALAENDRLLVAGPDKSIASLDSRLGGGGSVRPLPADDVAGEYELHRRVHEVRLPARSHLVGVPLAQTYLGEGFGINVLGIERDGQRFWLPGPDDKLRPGDLLLVQGRASDFALLQAFQQLEPTPARSGIDSLSTEERGFAEFMLEPRSRHIGARLGEMMFRQRYGLNVLAIWHRHRVYRTALADRRIDLGDPFLVHGPRERIEGLVADPEFLCLTRADATPLRRNMAPLAAGIMAMVLLVVLTGRLPIYVAAPAGALAMVLTGCCTIQDAYRYISWRAVLLIAGMLSLGHAMQESGAAELIATSALGSLAPFGPMAVVGGLFLLTALSAQVMPTAAVAVLMAPIGLSTAETLGLSPHALLMAVAIGASCAFLSPVGHPVNLLVMGVGGYRFTDYARVGLPLLMIVFLVVVLVLPLVWVLTA